MIKDVIYYNHPILRQKCPLVTDFNDHLKSVAQDLIDTMHADDTSIGVACPQINSSLRMFVIDFSEYHDFDYSLDDQKPPYQDFFPLICVNPEILSLQGDEYGLAESCMSLPDLRVTVYRQENITLKYQDLTGTSHIFWANNFVARAIQHELDHLNGILTIDRTDKRELFKVESKLKQLQRQTKKLLRTQ